MTTVSTDKAGAGRGGAGGMGQNAAGGAGIDQETSTGKAVLDIKQAIAGRKGAQFLLRLPAWRFP